MAIIIFLRMIDNRKWLFRKIRSSRKYFYFLIFQLVLSTSIILFAMLHKKMFRNPVTLYGEYILIICILLDL